MATNDVSQRKCFTYVWKLKNAPYCWQKDEEFLESPVFIVDELQASLWTLLFYPRFGPRGDQVVLALRRKTDDTMIDIEISQYRSLAENRTILHAISSENHIFGKESNVGKFCYYEREKVCPTRRTLGSFCETFIARCRIWKSVGEISDYVQCLARTRIGVEKRSFIWKIGDLNDLQIKNRYKIKSLNNNKERNLIILRLWKISDQCTKLGFFTKDRRIRYLTYQLFSIDGTGNTIWVLRDKVWFNTLAKNGKKYSGKAYKKNAIVCFLNGALTLKCKVAISFGVVSEEIEGTSLDGMTFESEDSETNSSGKFSVSKEVLQESFKSLIEQQNEQLGLRTTIDNLQSAINNGHLSDINLRTNKQTFPVHKFILSARCPVFKAMFSAGKDTEKDGFIDIKEFDDDTVSRLLLYIYSSKVEKLEWKSAVDLFVAANQYQIFALKDICSNYLKSQLSHVNACEALVFADTQKDENLKTFVRDYILKHAKSIISSKNWDHLMSTNLQLATETMRLEYLK